LIIIKTHLLSLIIEMNLEIKDKSSTNNSSANVLGNATSSLSWVFSENDFMKELLVGHKNHIEDLWLSLDEEVGDWITTKEFIHFSSHNENINKIFTEEKLESNRPKGQAPAIFALNLWKYLFYWNPSELMWALSSYSDEGVVFTSPWKKWYNGKSESIISDEILQINPIEIIDAWEFFRKYWYNEEYSKFYGKTIEAWKNA